MSSIKRILDNESNDTWAQLYSRLILNACSSKDVVSNDDLNEFLFNTATANGTNTGFLMASVLTTINFILSTHKSYIQIRDGFDINLNTLFLFVGQPSTGIYFIFSTLLLSFYSHYELINRSNQVI